MHLNLPAWAISDEFGSATWSFTSEDRDQLIFKLHFLHFFICYPEWWKSRDTVNTQTLRQNSPNSVLSWRLTSDVFPSSHHAENTGTPTLYELQILSWLVLWLGSYWHCAEDSWSRLLKQFYVLSVAAWLYFSSSSSPEWKQPCKILKYSLHRVNKMPPPYVVNITWNEGMWLAPKEEKGKDNREFKNDFGTEASYKFCVILHSDTGASECFQGENLTLVSHCTRVKKQKNTKKNTVTLRKESRLTFIWEALPSSPSLKNTNYKKRFVPWQCG